jgi:NAD(P)-dependent dehydrogenase (short-subunit alcohol dehydrogenase family)
MSRSLTILVTGATSGIGKHTALHLHARGHRVIGTGRNEKALSELRAAGVEAVAMDVCDAASVEAAKAEVARITNGHGLDVLVNNAGYGLFGPVEMIPDEDVKAQYETNVFGLLRVTRAFLPQMRERRAGRVVNVSSVGGRMTFPLGGVYNSTKYAVDSLSHALRMELHQFGVRVSTVEPGYIKTDFTARTMELLGKYVSDSSSPYAHTLKAWSNAGERLEKLAVGPGSVARAIEHAATSRFPRARYVAPFYNAMGPAMLAMLPRWLTDWFFRRSAGLVLPAAVPA